MATTSVQLWERIHDAGLASTDQCRSWATEIAKSSSPDLLHDSNRLAAELIRREKITAFQANVLCNNLPVSLACGPFRVTEPLESRLGENWFQAIELGKAKVSPRLCYQLTAQDLKQSHLRAWPPSLELAARSVPVSHPSLDRWLFVGIERENVLGFCEPFTGKSLTDISSRGPMDWQSSVTMVEQIASGIQKIHDAKIVHGNICSDSIWRIDEIEFVLRRDPFFPPANPYASNSFSIVAPVREIMLGYAAPEFTLPNAIPTFQTDLYALGCIWYQALTGVVPFGADRLRTPQEWATAHLTQSIQPRTSSLLPPTLQRCLDHLLAKNPSSRFATANALIKAIELAVIQSVETKTSPAMTSPATRPIKEPVPPVGSAANSRSPEKTPIATAPISTAPIATAPIAKMSSIVAQPTSDDPTSKANPTVINAASPDLLPARPKGGKSKKKAKKKKKPAWVLPAMIGGGCLLFGVVITLLVRNGTEPNPVVPRTNLASATQTTTTSSVEKPESNALSTVPSRLATQPSKQADSVGDMFSISPDDGQSLWAPPYAGSTYSLELFPAGLEAVLFTSSNMWHGRSAAGALNKWWNEAQPELAKQIASAPLLSDIRIQSVDIGLYPSKNPGLPNAVFRVTFSQPTAIESIVKDLSDFKWRALDTKNNVKKGFWINETHYNKTSIAMDEFQSDGSAMVKRAVIGPAELLTTLPDLNGGPAPLRRQLESLLKTTDSRFDLTILAAPSFLFGDGRELLAGMPKLQDALRNALDESIQAVLFATSLEPRWYMEWRMLSSEARDVGKLAATLRASLVSLPEEFEKGLSSGTALHPYWRALGLRYPQMMRALNRYLRIGLEDGQVVANVYLPSEAIGNIAISSWMALNQSVEASSSNVGGKQTQTTKPLLKSIEEILESAITISFEQESLEAALQLIASEVAESVVPGAGISMTIDGAAFQKEGITRNQSIRAFKHSGVPLRVILTDLVRRANPVTTVKSATERNQKVVWLILDDPDRTGAKKIELTTRSNAEDKNYLLPKEFVAK